MSAEPIRLLLVDDDEGDRFLVKQALSEEFPNVVACEVSSASDFARELRQPRPFDLAISDCTLGWSDGLEVVETVHRKFPGCPIIMFTGTESLPTRRLRRAVLAGLVDILPKSGKGSDQLKLAVREALRAKPEQVRTSLSEAQPQFASIVRGIVDCGLLLLDERGLVLTWNDGAARIYGYDADEMLGKPKDLLFLPEDLAAAKPRVLLEKAREAGHVKDEGWRVRKDGARCWVEVTITALRDNEGRLVGFCQLTRDLTERRGAEERLRGSEERYRALVTSVQDYAIFLLDAEGRVISWNLGAQKIKRYRPDEILGKTISVFYPEEDQGKWRRLLAEAARSGRVEDEGWRVRKGGERFWADVVITALRNEAGLLTGFAKVTRDLTEKRQAEEELARRAAELARLNRELDLFSSTVSHDLKAPLRQIQGFAQILERRPLDADAKDLVGRMAASAARLQSMTEELLSYSRLGREGLPVAEVDLGALVERVRAQFSAEIEAAKARCEVRGPFPAVLADGGALERVLANLLGNALKFTNPGSAPDVALRCETGRGLVRVFVEDRGIGVSEPLHLFEPFHRGESQGVFPGHGLGLAIVRRAVERMGGRVGFQPREGGGSRFWIELKAAN